MSQISTKEGRLGFGLVDDPLGVLIDGKRKPRDQKPVQTSTPAPTGTGVPLPLVQLTISSSHVTVNGHTLAKLLITFVLNPIDGNFAGAHLWAKGYNASPVWQLIGDVQSSPATLYLEATGESISIQAVSFGPSYLTSSATVAPTVVVTL